MYHVIMYNDTDDRKWTLGLITKSAVVKWVVRTYYRFKYGSVLTISGSDNEWVKKIVNQFLNEAE
jgi:hypothetical protein